MIVIDVGCADYGRYDSLRYLSEVFDRAPEVIYGCDPSPSMTELMARYRDDPLVVTELRLAQEAAWTYNGFIGFQDAELGSGVDEMYGPAAVACFDLAEFIRSLPSDEEIVLKIDAEGSEYVLLEHLIATRTDELLKLAWIEWHCLSCRRASGLHEEGCRDKEGAKRQLRIIADLNCGYEEWRR